MSYCNKINFIQLIFMDNHEIDYKRAAEQLRKGEPVFGKEGALAIKSERHFEIM